MENEDEDIIKDNIGDGSNQHCVHGGFRIAFRPDEIIHPHANGHQNTSRYQYLHIIRSIGQYIGAGAKHDQKRLDKDQAQNTQTNPDEQKQDYGIADDLLGFFSFFLPQANRNQGRRPHADQHSQSHQYYHNGEAHRDTCQCQFPYPAAHKNAIGHIIQRMDQHGGYSRQGEFQQQARDTPGPHFFMNIHFSPILTFRC